VLLVSEIWFKNTHVQLSQAPQSFASVFVLFSLCGGGLIRLGVTGTHPEKSPGRQSPPLVKG